MREVGGVETEDWRITNGETEDWNRVTGGVTGDRTGVTGREVGTQRRKVFPEVLEIGVTSPGRIEVPEDREGLPYGPGPRGIVSG